MDTRWGRVRQSIDLVATIAVTIAAISVVWTLWFDSSPSGAQTPRTEAPAPDEPVSLVGAHFKGNVDAPVVLLEFSDFQCPFCARFAVETLPKLVADYVETGRVLLAFRHLPLEALHPAAVEVSVAAECAAAQGHFWSMHDSLFTQPDAYRAPAIQQHVAAIGLDAERFQLCLRDETVANAVREGVEEALAIGVRSTPTFLVGVMRPDGRLDAFERISGAKQVVDFALALERVLNETNQ